MGFSPNTGTTVWAIRERIGDTDAARAAFDDEEISRILVDRVNDKDLSAAECSRRLAANPLRAANMMGISQPTPEMFRTLSDQFLRVADAYERMANDQKINKARAEQEAQRAEAIDVEPELTEWTPPTRAKKFDDYEIERELD